MHKIIIVAVVIILVGCKEKYFAPVLDTPTGYLVVEGVVNNGIGETKIRLSRTSSLSADSFIKVTGALVAIENENNIVAVLPDAGEGNYILNNLFLDTSQQYRLSIKTSTNEEFYSDYIKVKSNPPIDSISWERKPNGAQLYINTHDPANAARYYQWEFDETWEFHSAYSSSIKYIYGPPPQNEIINVVMRNGSDPQMYQCWKYNSSSNLLLGSSAKLSDDVIHLPLNFIENGSQKLSVKYSILVRQYAWSKAGYEFLERMKKNTESVGSVFDAQPSQLNGNIHCNTNPNQPVIGFFNICTIQESRIFIKRSDLDWSYDPNCQEILILNNPDELASKASGTIPTYPEKLAGPNTILSFYAAPDFCVDCRITGSNVKPPYWQ